MSTSLVMPSLGESVIEGTITKWLVHEGDMVAREQPVVSVATDKADSDVPATSAGKVVRILAPEGATVKVGEALCEIDSEGAAASATPAQPVRAEILPPPSPPPPAPSTPAQRDGGRAPAAAAAADNGSGRGLSSPVVRKLALEHGVDLEQVQGSGSRGRVTREDVIRAAEQPPPESTATPAVAERPPPASRVT